MRVTFFNLIIRYNYHVNVGNLVMHTKKSIRNCKTDVMDILSLQYLESVSPSMVGRVTLTRSLPLPLQCGQQEQ